MFGKIYPHKNPRKNLIVYLVNLLKEWLPYGGTDLVNCKWILAEWILAPKIQKSDEGRCVPQTPKNVKSALKRTINDLKTCPSRQNQKLKG